MKKNETAPDVSKPDPSVNRLIPDFNLWADGNGRLLEGWARCNKAGKTTALMTGAQAVAAMTKAATVAKTYQHAR